MRKALLRTPVAAAAVLLLFAAPASAAGTDGSTASVSGGSLAVSSVTAGDFSAALTGATQTVTTSFSTEVADPRGTGAGWNVTVNPTQFTDSGTSETLATDALSISGSTVTPGTDSSSVTASPHSGAITSDGATPTTLLSVTTPGEGMGTYTIGGTLGLSVRADAYAGTYVSTFTVDIAQPV